MNPKIQLPQWAPVAEMSNANLSALLDACEKQLAAEREAIKRAVNAYGKVVDLSELEKLVG